jgi:hypothetical protein
MKCCGSEENFAGYDPDNFDPIYFCKICDNWWGFDAKNNKGWYPTNKKEDLLHFKDTPRGKETAEYVARYKELDEKARREQIEKCSTT